MSASLSLRKINPFLLRHLAAGAPALLLDFLGMEALLATGWNVHLARALSCAVAAALAFFLHRQFTYARQRKAKTVHGQPIPFGTLQVAAGVLSYGLFIRIIYSLPHPVGFAGRAFALALGAAAGFFFNYMMLRRLLPAKAMKESPQAAKTVVSSKTFKRVLLWLLVICLTLQSVREHHQFVMSWPVLKDPLGPFDPDPFVRLTQVRQWLTGGFANFFDHTVRNVNAPDGGISTPWTRPLDIVLSVLYLFMPHNLSMNVRLLLAATWMPPMIGLGAIALLTLAVRRSFNNLHALGFVALLLLFSLDTLYYYTPGDSDHHGLLSMLWCGVLAMLLRSDYDRQPALIAGSLLGVMVWVSPEALILIAAVYALLGALALWQPRRMIALAFTAMGAALVSTGALFVEIPADKILTTLTYDSISIVQVALLWFCGMAAAGLTIVYRRKTTFATRFFAAAVAGAGVMVAMELVYPRFFLGPLADVDPFIFTGFLPRVGEARMLFTNSWDEICRQLMEPVLAAGLIAVALRMKHVRPQRRLSLWILSFLLAVTTVMTIYQIRWAYYMHPVAIVAIAMLVAGATAMSNERPLVWLRYVPRQGRAYIVLWLAFFFMNVLIHLNPTTVTESSSCMSQVRYVIQTQQLQPLLGNNNNIVYAPEDAGGDMLFFTPYRIIASNYHREGAGLKDMREISSARSAKEAVPLLKKHQVSAMLFCPAFQERASWLRTVAESGGRPSWLIPVGGLHFMDDPGRKPVLFRVRGLK